MNKSTLKAEFINAKIKDAKYIGVSIKTEGSSQPEIIINPRENFDASLDNAYEISVDESNLVKENTKAADAIKSWFSKVQEKNDAAA